jgi:protein TonB
MLVEGLIESRRTQMDKRRVAMLPLVIGVHIIVAIGLVISSVWQVSYLEEPPINIALVASAPPPPPAAAKAKSAQTQTKTTPPPTNANVTPIAIPDFTPQVLAMEDTSGGDDYGVEGGVDWGGVGTDQGGVLGGIPGGVAVPRPPEPDQGPVIVGGDVQAPQRLTELIPIYTEPARKARIEGIVILQLTISKTGDVLDVKVLKGLPMGLTEAAVAAARQQKFKPAYRSSTGKPVDCLYTITVQFKIS